MGSSVDSTTMMKSNFTRTCNRFSQFLKERRSIAIGGDLGGFNSNNRSTSSMEEVVVEEKKSLDLFPLTSTPSSNTTCNKSHFESSSNINININMNMNMDVDFSPRMWTQAKEETEKRNGGSMTIIYDGKVVVIDGLHDEMAQEIMSMASQQSVATHLTPDLSDIPIARGASLLRFMEKRKHRIAASSAPYRLKRSLSSRKHLVGLGQQLQEEDDKEKQLEFKLW